MQYILNSIWKNKYFDDTFGQLEMVDSREKICRVQFMEKDSNVKTMLSNLAWEGSLEDLHKYWEPV